MNVYENKKSISTAEKMPPMWKHLWVGASLGLYFGWFFRPVREPSFFVVIFLGLLITVVLALWQTFRRKQDNLTFRQIIGKMPLAFFQYAVVLAILESRHFAFDFGGRWAVIVMTVIMGGLSGVWFAYRNNR
jgi:hypothetical protein